MPLFSIPLSGLTASSTAMSTIANNLANLNTVGYKGSDTQFADLFYQTLATNGSGDPVQVGAGTGGSRDLHQHELGQPPIDGRAHRCSYHGQRLFRGAAERLQRLHPRRRLHGIARWLAADRRMARV